jgi:uncharacterized protein YkwD
MSNPNAQEQELLELINRMRLRPQEELQILLDSADPTNKSYDPAIKKALDDFNVNISTLKTQWSKLITALAPVAWASNLNQAATNHNQAMIQSDTQAHQVLAQYDSNGNLIVPLEPDLAARLTAVNYQYTLAEENIYAYGQSVLHTHAGFAIDWGRSTGTNSDGSPKSIDGIQNPAGHREAILSNEVREVGISITPENDSKTKVGSLVVTEDFGNRSALDKKAWLVGVAFQDLNQDGWYEAGEGLKDVQVKITGIDGNNFSDTINVADAGGYQELLDPGKYRVDFIRAGNIVGTQTTSIDPNALSNVKLDLVIPVQMLNSTTSNTPTTQAATTSTTQTIDDSQQVIASTNLKTTSSTSNLLDFRTDNFTSNPQDLTNKTIAINFTGVTADADYHNYGGLYRVEDTQGTVIDTDGKSYAPKDSGYLNAALRRSQVTSDGVQLDRNGLSNTVNLKGGYIYAPFLVVNASVNDVLNSKNSATKPQVYFDYVAANPDGFQHTKFLGADKFGFEDLFGGGDRDYNDLIFQINAKIA